MALFLMVKAPLVLATLSQGVRELSHLHFVISVLLIACLID